MKLTTNAFISLAFAISASAAPLADAAVVAATEADAIRERSLEKRDVICLNRGPKVGPSLTQVGGSLLTIIFAGQSCRYHSANRRVLRVRQDLINVLDSILTMCS
jgi:hypothetical protein